jgi:hypothetical protein
MFQHIRRHQKWLWIVISAAVIISFVVYFTPDANIGRGGRGGGDANYGSINGRSIKQKELLAAYREAQLRYLFSYGNWPGNDEFGREMGFDVEREAENRLFLAEKIRELNIQVSEQEVADYIADAFSDRQTKAFRQDAYDQFVKTRLAERGMGEEDLTRFIRTEVAVGHLISVAGLSGTMLPPREAEAQYRRENEQLTASVLTFSQSNYVAGVNLDPLALQVFYTNRMSIYRVPERVAVSYVKFDATNFLAEADAQIAKITNYNQVVDMEYQKRGVDSFKDAAGKVLEAEAAKVQIRSEHRMETALVAARRKAGSFVEEIQTAFEANPSKTNLLEELALSRGMIVASTAPFTQRDGPREMRTLARFSEIAFKLSAEEPYSTPIPDEECIYVIGIKERLPSMNPPFDTVKDRVTDEYRRGQALEAARNAAKAFAATLTNGLAAGRKFEELCAEAKLTPINLPAFSLATRTLPEAETNRVSLSDLKNAASALAPGRASGAVGVRDGSMVVYLHSRAPVEDAKVQLELPIYQKTLREGRHYEAFQEWFRKEKELARMTGLPSQQANRKEAAE